MTLPSLFIVLLIWSLAVFVKSSCPATDAQGSCVSLETVQASGDSISLSFTYDTATSQICTITGGSITLASAPTQPIYLPGPQTPTVGSYVTVQAVGGVDQATNIVVGFVDTSGNSGTLGSSSYNALYSGMLAYLVYSNTLRTVSINEQISGASTVTGCTATTFGDPHFSGFHNQQFCVRGVSGDVMNILSSPSMRVNSRLVQVNEGQSLSAMKQKLVRVASGNVLPQTHWFDHEGPYLGELGVAVDGHRLYANAGKYQNGWSVVQLDGADFPISAERTVIGQGADAVTIIRPDLYTVQVKSHHVRLSFINSDLFFNIHDVHLEYGYTQRKVPLGGALGQTSNHGFVAHWGNSTWEAEQDKAHRVDSGNLFDISTPSR